MYVYMCGILVSEVEWWALRFWLLAPDFLLFTLRTFGIIWYFWNSEKKESASHLSHLLLEMSAAICIRIENPAPPPSERSSDIWLTKNDISWTNFLPEVVGNNLEHSRHDSLVCDGRTPLLPSKLGGIYH